nr:hypothetical protein [Kofleriaceae bacterium]
MVARMAKTRGGTKGKSKSRAKPKKAANPKSKAKPKPKKAARPMLAAAPQLGGRAAFVDAPVVDALYSVWCPQCDKRLFKDLDVDTATDDAADHNENNDGHHAATEIQ